MIKQSALALAVLAAGVSTQAQEASALSVTVDVTYVTDYTFRGQQLDNASIQPGIEASYGDFYAGIWHSSALKKRVGGTETDFYAGYGFAVNDTISLDAGVTRYTYEAAKGDDSTEVYVGLTADVLLSPSLYYYYDFDNEKSSYIGSIGYSLPVDAINASLDFTGTVGFIQAPNSSDYTYASIGVAIPYALSETATLTVGAEYIYNDSKTLAGFQNDKSGFLVGSIGLSIGF